MYNLVEGHASYQTRQEQSNEWRMGGNYQSDSKDSSDTVGCKPNVNPPVPCHMQEELTACYKQSGYSLQNLCNHPFILLSTDKSLGLNAVPRLGYHSSTTWPSWSSFRLNQCRLARHLQDHKFWGWGERWVVYAKKKRGRRKKSIIIVFRYSDMWCTEGKD